MELHKQGLRTLDDYWNEEEKRPLTWEEVHDKFRLQDEDEQTWYWIINTIESSFRPILIGREQALT